MFQSGKKLGESLLSQNPELSRLYAEHIRFEQDLEALYSLKYFPPEVEQKIKEIKINKLKGKDRMRELLENM